MLDTLKNTKINIRKETKPLHNVCTVQGDKTKDNAKDMKSGKTTTGKPSTLPKKSISEVFFLSLLREDGQTKLSTDTLSNTMDGLLNAVCSWTF